MATYQEVMKNYVKFLRGTPAAWETVKETANGDTLYFISEPDADTGKLYLGKKLIANGTISLANSTLGDLQDILLSESIQPSSLLVYEDGNWVDKPLGTVLSAIVSIMVGATEENPGVAGLVPVPQAGQQNLFLKGDATWANPIASLFGADDDPTKTIREIAQEEVGKLFEAGDVDKLDTLKDALDWISNHDSLIDVAQAEVRLQSLEEAVFDQMVEQEDGSDPVLVSGLVSNVTLLQTKYETVDRALKWQDLEAEETVEP